MGKMVSLVGWNYSITNRLQGLYVSIVVLNSNKEVELQKGHAFKRAFGTLSSFARVDDDIAFGVYLLTKIGKHDLAQPNGNWLLTIPQEKAQV
jgi:hypothetical protein